LNSAKINTAIDKVNNLTGSPMIANELRESLELNALFMKYSPIYAFIKIISESESKVLMASENFIDMVGIPGSEMVGKNMFDLFPADFAAKITADDWSVVSSKEGINIEEELMGRNYTTIKFPIILEDKTLLAGYTIDITDRKKVEAELKIKNEELKLVNAQKDRLFSILSHDLLNPFNSILGFSQLILDQIEEKDYTRIEECAKIVNHSSLRAVDLLKNLLGWSILQEGRIECSPEHIRMVDLVNNILDLFTYITNQKSILISNALPSELFAYADRNMISIVMRNLISNAIKFSMPNGNITIFADEEQNGLKVSVSDTGVGIPKKKLETLFSPDKRFSTSGTQHELGTGFGLILCKEFVEMHGGELFVESIEGKGSTFSFTIPIIK
jgi:signal transduction histidine kinase